MVRLKQGLVGEKTGGLVTDSYEGVGTSLSGIILLSTDARIVSGAALGRRAGRADSFRKKIDFSDWESFEPFNIVEVFSTLAGNSRNTALNTLDDPLGNFTSKATRHLLSWLSENRRKVVAVLKRLLKEQTPQWLRDPATDAARTYFQQLDGLKIGLEIAGLDRSLALEGLNHPTQPDDLPLVNLLEDQIVVNDVFHFAGWDMVPHIVSGASFRDVASGREVRTFLANKLPLEQQTGADIVYYVQDSDSFVLVQYKRCRTEEGVARYRPDKQFEKETQRMRELERPTTSPPNGGGSLDLKGHRIGPGFCFINVCLPGQPIDTELSRGKYFDLKGFDSSLETGEKGGRHRPGRSGPSASQVERRRFNF